VSVVLILFSAWLAREGPFRGEKVVVLIGLGDDDDDDDDWWGTL